MSLETKDREEARKRRDDLLKGAADLSTKVAWRTVRRGQAMPDVGPNLDDRRLLRHEPQARAFAY